MLQQLVALTALGLAFESFACGGSQSGSVTYAPTVVTIKHIDFTGQGTPTDVPQGTPKVRLAKTLEAARSLVDFTVQAPAAVRSTLTFFEGHEYGIGNQSYLELVYRPSDEESADRGRHRVLITESRDRFSSGDPSTPIRVEGVTGQIVHGEDIGNPGLVVILWQKDGLSFSASTFLAESFAEQDLIALVNSME